MDKKELRAREVIETIISNHFETSEFTDKTRIAADFGADSLDGVEILMDIEDAFDIYIEDEEAASMSTVGELIKYVITRI